MYGILVDVTRCRGCEECVAACVAANRLDADQAETDRFTSRDGLSADRLTSILPVGEGRFARKSCLHCLEPACVSACLVGGLTRADSGAVVYDPDKCIGCRYCMLACPVHVPRYQWSATAPLVSKCSLCADRLCEGLVPACVEACPYDALTFGKRGELLDIAHRRLLDDPHRYLDHVWGETEFGGTAVLYISDVDLVTLGWPEAGREIGPIPHLTEPLIAQTPGIGLSVAASLLGVNWIIRRRMRLTQERIKTADQEQEQEDDA